MNATAMNADRIEKDADTSRRLGLELLAVRGYRKASRLHRLAGDGTRAEFCDLKVAGMQFGELLRQAKNVARDYPIRLHATA